MLRTIDVYTARGFYSSACENKRYAVAVGRKIVDIFGICAKMVGNKYHNRILPLRQTLEAPHEIADNAVGERKGIEPIVCQTAIRHFKWLMTTRSLHYPEMSLGKTRVGFQIIIQTLEKHIVVRSPFAKTL